MLKNLILSAAAAGVAAGLVTAVIQHVTTTPLIIEAEKYELETPAAPDHGAGASIHQPSPAGAPVSSQGIVASPSSAAEEWAPAGGFERTLFTSLATAVTGVGFGLALLGAMALAGIAINARTGLAFGMSGFIAVALAPALGLPPEIPGSGAAALDARQIWWFFTVAATVTGVAGLVLGRNVWLRTAGVALIALPHIVGAPHPQQYISTAPAELAGHFAAASLAVTAIFWAVLGYASGAFYERFSRGG